MVPRVSEYLYTTKSTHWLPTERVQLEMPNGNAACPQSRSHTSYGRTHPHQNSEKRPTRTRAHAPFSPCTPHIQILLRVRDVNTCSVRAPQIQLSILCNPIRRLDTESSSVVPPIEKHGGLPRNRLRPHIHPLITNRWSANTRRGRHHR